MCKLFFATEGTVLFIVYCPITWPLMSLSSLKKIGCDNLLLRNQKKYHSLGNLSVCPIRSRKQVDGSILSFKGLYYCKVLGYMTSPLRDISLLYMYVSTQKKQFGPYQLLE